jgi:hypothetical protein
MCAVCNGVQWDRGVYWISEQSSEPTIGLLSLDLLVDLVLRKVESAKFVLAVGEAVFWGMS